MKIYASKASVRSAVSQFVVFLVMGLACIAANAQTLTPEQRQMLNQLPPLQREAALQQIRNLRQAAGSQRQQADAGDDEAEDSERAARTAEPDTPAGPPVFRAGNTLVVSAQVSETLRERRVEAEIADAEGKVKLLLSGNPYQLDGSGRVLFPGIGEMVLAGLTEDQASLRLAAEPSLSHLLITVKRLPVQPTGIAALEPFGYSLFKRDKARMEADSSAPVTADYVVGPGDTLRMQMYGNQNADYELPVERNGTVQIPEIGPITVAGLTYSQVQELVAERVRQHLIGTQVSVTLGELRSVTVFVVGDVTEPGSYALDPLSTITSALVASNGVAESGSLRNIQLKRNGQLVQELDVYDVLLRGDTRADIRLQAGDVVFVPPVGKRVTAIGEVNRPAVYEFRDEATVSDIVRLAGGLKPTADGEGTRIERISSRTGIQVIAANLQETSGGAARVLDGDVLLVPERLSYRGSSVRLLGNVHRPGDYEWNEGLTISGLIPGSRDLKDGSDIHYALIRRETEPNEPLEAFSANLAAAWSTPGGPADLGLRPRDTVYVFSLEVGRRHIVQPLLEELRLRSSRDAPLPVASIGGQVNAAGRYPLESGMRIADLVRAGGGLAESAYLKEAELTRYVIVDGESRQAELVTIDLQAALDGEPRSNILLAPFDNLNIKTIPRWQDQKSVRISGEVAFPGEYTIRQGETLTSVLERAGGLTELASRQGSVFTRDFLKARERDQLLDLANRIESDLATLSLSDPGQSEAISVGQSLLKQLRETEPVGRLVIDLNGIIQGSAEDITLRDGDLLAIPVKAQEVTVLGEVQYRTSHLYEPSLSREDYIDKSGGVTRKADARQTYVVRANGEVVTSKRSLFFARGGGNDIRPGDTIVVPLHTDKIRPLTLWTSATQIVYNLAIAAAAINSF